MSGFYYRVSLGNIVKPYLLRKSRPKVFSFYSRASPVGTSVFIFNDPLILLVSSFSSVVYSFDAGRVEVELRQSSIHARRFLPRGCSFDS